MIPQPFRLKLSSQTPFVGKKKYLDWCVVISAPSPSPQWAVRVGKKIDNRAVVRNRLRRQLTQWLYRERSSLRPQQTLIILRRKPDDINVVMDELKCFLFTDS